MRGEVEGLLGFSTSFGYKGVSGPALSSFNSLAPWGQPPLPSTTHSFEGKEGRSGRARWEGPSTFGALGGAMVHQ